MGTSNYLPPDRSVITPQLCVRACGAAIDWYVRVFDAVETGPRYVDPDGRVGHASLRIGGELIELSDSYPDYGVAAPEEGSSTATFSLQLYVPDADATVAAAGQAGARVLRPVAEESYGSRTGTLIDPFGVRWSVSTHIRSVAADDLAAAAEQFAKAGAEPGPLS